MRDLNDMFYFAEVVGRGSFAEAARALGVPKSRLSRRIARLEDQLGVRLLQRTTRKLSLTSAGELYYPHCTAMLDEAEAAATAVAQVQTEPRGVVRVVCPVTLAQSVVGEILPDYIQQHPQVQVNMQVSNRVVDLVEDGIDVALRVRTSVADSGSLVVKHLGRTQSLLVASPGLLKDHGTPQEPAHLARFPTVTMSAQDGRGSWSLMGPNGAQHFVVHRPRLVADDLLTLKLAVLGGSGIGVLPDYMCRGELADGRLQLVLPTWAPPPGIVHAVFGTRRGLIPAVRSFLDFLGERMT
jgi:DNA-binding transcriptional LysR family regulator